MTETQILLKDLARYIRIKHFYNLSDRELFQVNSKIESIKQQLGDDNKNV